jgi:hypothetical protein
VLGSKTLVNGNKRRTVKLLYKKGDFVASQHAIGSLHARQRTDTRVFFLTCDIWPHACNIDSLVGVGREVEELFDRKHTVAVGARVEDELDFAVGQSRPVVGVVVTRAVLEVKPLTPFAAHAADVCVCVWGGGGSVVRYRKK